VREPEPEVGDDDEPDGLEVRPALLLRSSAERWRGAVEAVRQASPRHGKSLAFGRLVRLSAEEVAVAFTADADFHRTTVSGTGKPTVEKALGAHFGRPVRLVVEAAGAEKLAPSIAEEETRERAEHERSIEGRVRQHPAIKAALRILGGELEHVFVVERERPSAPPDDGDDGA
jgi:hypothetical protein